MIGTLRKFFLIFLCGICQTSILSAVPFSSAKQKSSENEISSSISKHKVSRIVSLGPSATEIIFALGAGNNLVARTDFCNYPPQAERVPSIGGFDAKTFSLESIIALEPDFVYLFSGMHSHLINPLQNLGIKVYVSDCKSIDDVKKEIKEVGEILGAQKKAEEIISDIDQKISEAQKIVKEKKGKILWNDWCSAPSELNPYPKVYYEINSSPYMTVSKSSFVNGILADAGCINIFGDEKSAYPVVSEEAVIYGNCEIMIFPEYYEKMLSASEKNIWSQNNLEVQNEVPDFIKQRAEWENIAAIRLKRIIILDSEIFERPGPRVGDAVLALAKKVWSYKDIRPLRVE
ncbi:MAG: ABC transporter substrate-binding protein [Treponema sp.]|nr:ABC transporter substrate-binding protein [Candidatus Treponema merdequi]